MGQLASQPEWSLVKPATVISTYLSWASRYRVPVWLAGNRAMAERVTGRLLLWFWGEFRGCAVAGNEDKKMEVSDE